MARVKWLLLLLLISIFILPHEACAEQPGLAVVFVLDNSGSMKQNDGENLRLKAVEMFMARLCSNDQVSLVGFSDKARVVVPLQGLESYEQRERVRTGLAQIAAGDDWTDMDAGLKAAFAQLEGIQGPAQGLVIFVSDGKPEPNLNFHRSQGYRENYLSGLWSTVQSFALRGWPIYTIGLSEKADMAVLQRMAQETGGLGFSALFPNALPGIFQELLSGLNDSQNLAEFTALLNQSEWSSPNLVQVDDSMDMLSFRGLSESNQEIELRIKTPKGSYLKRDDPGVNLVSGPNYNFVSLSEPIPGTYEIQAKGQGVGRLNVDYKSRYSLRVLQPMPNGIFPTGSPQRFMVRVYENGEPIDTADGHTLQLEYNGQRLLTFAPGGSDFPKGIFLAELPQFTDRSGLNTFFLQLTDKNQNVLRKRLLLYAKDQPYLEVVPFTKAWARESTLLEVRLKYKDKALTGTKLNLIAAVSNGGRTTELKLSDDAAQGDRVAGDGTFSYRFTPEEAGSYLINFYLRGNYAGRIVNYGTGGHLLEANYKPSVEFTLPPRVSVGRDGVLAIEVVSDSSVSEHIVIRGTVGDYPIPVQPVVLAPKSTTVIKLQVPWETGGKEFPAQIFAMGTNVKVTANPIDFEVYMRTPIQDFWHTRKTLIIVAGILVLGLTLLIGGGFALRFFLNRRLIVKGILVLSKDKSNSPRKLIFLNPLRKSKLTLGWAMDDDIIFDSDANNPEESLLMQARLAANSSGFIQGWRCLFRKTGAVVVLSCQPGTVFRLRARGDRRPVTRSKTVLLDGDEIYYQGYKLVFRKYG